MSETSKNEWQEDDYDLGPREEAAKRALAEADFDFFEAVKPRLPKAEIGRYVAEQGFHVPLIELQEEWETAFDEGVAMIRSESRDDYDGFGGLFSSVVINEDFKRAYSGQAEGFDKEFGELILRGLRSGELLPEGFMERLLGYNSWSDQRQQVLLDAQHFGRIIDLPYSTEASRWRYVPGSNARVFADPHVEGRYHIGLTPYDPGGNYQGIGSYQVEADQYDEPLEFRKHDHPFVAREFIEVYEQIRALPYFDATECPVLELQQSPDGTIYFLQYFKTHQKREYTEPFELPENERTIRTRNVRGITPPEGIAYKLFLAPDRHTAAMESEAILCGLIRPRRMEVQMASMMSPCIIHEAYINFKDNHFDASPLFRPPLAIGLEDAVSNDYDQPQQTFQKMGDLIDQYRFRRSSSAQAEEYVDIRVTSNGHEAAIESDWEVKTLDESSGYRAGL